MALPGSAQWKGGRAVSPMKISSCCVCQAETIPAPEGWEPHCKEHFPYSDYEKALSRGEQHFPLAELIYLEAMEVKPLYWLMVGRDNLHYLPAENCVVCGNLSAQETQARKTATSQLIAFINAHKGGGFGGISADDERALLKIADSL